MPDQPLLEVNGVSKRFQLRKDLLSWRAASFFALSEISFDLAAGETLCVVGESGCGKSTLARILASLMPATDGEIRFDGEPIGGFGGRRLKDVRKSIQIVFQDPYSSLNPRLTLGRIIAEPLENFTVMGAAERRARSQAALEKVGLRASDVDRYPAQLSGGQRQRVGIARAIVAEPRIVIADEAVSALDVSVKAQILNLLLDLQQELGLAYVFITHDLGVVESIADRIIVMYLGRIVEVGRVDQVLGAPRHPYTQMLLDSVPKADPHARIDLKWVGTEIPSVMNPPSGCAFRTRCPKAAEICRTTPPVRTDAHGNRAACHFAPD